MRGVGTYVYIRLEYNEFTEKKTKNECKLENRF